MRHNLFKLNRGCRAMEREKGLKNAKRDVEITRSRSYKSKMKRKNKYWAEVSLGVILGLILGFIMESNLMIRGNTANESLCKFGLDTSLPSSVKLKHSNLNEDPLRIINFENAQVTPHNSQESLVFVGVMTAQKYLSTRAVAVYDTWGRELPGRIAFFGSETSEVPENRKDLPLVRLAKVDDSYPPQKKSFLMLQYMWENYGNRFEWFIRADDDVYIRPDKLESFLRSVDSRKPLFIGQAGRGNQEEFGLLSLEFDENFCMGGPGIILSRETLKSAWYSRGKITISALITGLNMQFDEYMIAPHIRYCLKNLYTTHEDVELGRCVRKFADISCTWSYEMQTILYHNSSGYEAFTGNLKQKEVNRAITLHPVKQHQHMYRLHNYMRQLKIQDLQHEIILLQRDIKKVFDQLLRGTDCKLCRELTNEKLSSEKYIGDVYVTGLEPSIQKFKPRSQKDIIHWDFMQRSIYSEGNLNPRRRIEAPNKEGIEDVIREFMEMINQFSRQRGRIIEYQDLLYGYYRVDPLHGADYILDMLLKYKKYRGRKMTVPVRRHAYLQQQFTGLEIREVMDEDEANRESGRNIKESNMLKKIIHDSLVGLKKRLPPLISSSKSEGRKIINFIVPLSGRYRTFMRFLKNYEEVCLKNEENTALLVILFRNNVENIEAKVATNIESLRSKYPKSSLKVIPVKDDFARAMALEIGSAHCKDDETNILFYIDVDMVFKREILDRIRRNTIRGQQVYFPIIYSEFDPNVVYGNTTDSPNHFLINEDTGYWRQFGFGIASVYKKDLKKVGGFDTSIRGWGKEDVNLYEKFISFSGNLTIFRSVDPSLIHIFHLVDCDPNLELSQLKMCKGTRKDTYGSVNQLAHCIYSNNRNFKSALNKKLKVS